MRERPVWRRGGVYVVSLLLVVGGVITACSSGSMMSPTGSGNSSSGTSVTTNIQMDIVSGSAQTAVAGSTLPNPVVVRATDARGRPKDGQIINFVVVSGGGSVYAGTSLTDRDGIAKDYWTLGPVIGQQVLEARAVDPRTGKRLVFATFVADATAPGGVVLDSEALSFESLGDTARLSVAGPGLVSAQGTGSGVSWQSTNTSVATVDATGLVRSTGDGTANIIASRDTSTDTATVSVRQRAATITITPDSLSLTPSEAFRLQEEVTDSNSYPVPTASVMWSSSSTSVATVAKDGTVHAVAPGSSTITASSGNVTATALVSVATATTAPTVSVSPATVSFSSLQDTTRLQVSATDSTGNTLSAGQLTWSSGNTAVATVSSTGLVRSVANGSTFVVASYQGVADTTQVTVAQRVATVSVSPASLSLGVGSSQGLAATAEDALGSTVSGATFTWQSADSAVATVSASGQVTGVAAGSTSISAWSGGASGSAQVTVTTTTTTTGKPTVSISPATLSFSSLQDTTRLQVSAKDSAGNALSAGQLTWSSGNTGVATVSSTGLVRSVANGSTFVVASYGGVADTIQVTIAQVVATVSVSPDSLSLGVGSSQSLTAAARDSLGSTVSGVTFTWSSSDTTVATVTVSGQVTGVAAGSASIAVRAGSASGAARVTVTTTTTTASKPTVSISPTTLSFSSLQDTTRLQVSAKDSAGNALSAGQLTWSSGNTGIATVSSTGLVRSVANGSTFVVASYQGVVDTAQVTVAQVVATVSVSPASVSLSVGSGQSLTAAAKDALGSTVSGVTFTWSSADTTVATVTTSGQVTGVAAGSTSITARTGGVSGTAQVSVTSTSSGGGGGGSAVGTGWPDQPPGYVMWNNQPWNALASNGWSHLNRASLSRIVADSTAPFSPYNVLEDWYPIGFSSAGLEPAVDWINMNGATSMFVGFWWKTSNPWQGHASGINKVIFFWQPGNHGNVVFTMLGPPGGPYYLRPYTEGEPSAGTGYLTQNVHQAPVVPGKWYRIEVQLYAGTNGNGIVRWWQNGVLMGSYTNLTFYSGGFGELQIAPTWGGLNGPNKQENDYFHYDHVYISLPGSGSTGGAGTGGQATVSSVTLSPTSATLTVGDSTTLQAVTKDSSGSVLTGQTVTWSSSATGVATVSSSGVVKAVAQGSATITATSGGVSGTAQVTVNATTTASIAPDTIFQTGFESGNLSKWQDGVNPSLQQVVTDPAHVHSGTHALQIMFPKGSDGGWLTRFFMPGYDSVYVRYWVMLDPNWELGTKLIALYGSRTDNQWSGMGQAGNCPTGTDFFATMLVTEQTGGNPPPMRFYNYWPAMSREPNGVTCYGRYGTNPGQATYASSLILTRGVWHKIEFWVKLNTPGQSNSVERFWVDGKLWGEWDGLSFRTSNILELNSLQITASIANGAPQTQYEWVDDVLVLRSMPNST